MNERKGKAATMSLLLVFTIAAVGALAGAEEEPENADVTSAQTADADAAADPGSPTADVGVHGDATDGDADAAVDTAPEIPPEKIAAGRKAFVKVARVLQSPRCMNCHPNGDRPLQTDESRPHTMNISRKSVKAGLDCSTCHRNRNSEAYGVEGGPPGAPHWGLPPEDTPMIFEGRTVTELCKQLKDPERNGGKDLDALLHHVAEDPLVLWGWNPGGDRTKPPLSHDQFVAAFTKWVQSAAACP